MRVFTDMHCAARVSATPVAAPQSFGEQRGHGWPRIDKGTNVPFRFRKYERAIEHLEPDRVVARIVVSNRQENERFDRGAQLPAGLGGPG